MLRAGLLGLLLLAPTPVTHLVLDAPDPDPTIAGAHQRWTATVHLTGALGPLPGLAGPVEITLDADASTRCQAPDQVSLDPITGQADIPLTCRPQAVGTYPLTLTARSPPHGSARWNGTLNVTPDRLQGTFSVGSPEGYEVPVSLSLTPEHLDMATVHVTVTGDLQGSPLAFQERWRNRTADGGAVLDRSIPARHGPGTYELIVEADGPNVDRFTTNATIHVPDPPHADELDLNVTVEPGQASVSLTGDSVNDDGKHKRPGDTLITRLTASHTDTVNVTVLRPASEGDVPIARSTLPVDPDGTAEHTFSHPVLPAGLLRVEATAGESAVARTAQIQDVDPEAHLEGPASALADGRALAFDLELVDPNHGSTTQDPGPVWGLPDVTWRLYHGSRLVEDWSASIGPFDGGPEGQAEASRIPWPDGTDWAQVRDGAATLPMTIDPPADVEAGTYRVSLYDPSGDRIGGTSFDLEPVPSIELGAGEPAPGDAWPVTVGIEGATERTTVNLTVEADGEPLTELEANASSTVPVPLPHPLPAGTRLVANATLGWPGRPAPPSPDATVNATVPDLPPTVEIHPVLDGVPTAAPLALHPANPHTVALNPSIVDPNGGTPNRTIQVEGPAGDQLDWLLDGPEGARVEIPEGAPPGRYQVRVSTEGASSTVEASLAFDVGAITRIRLDGPTGLALAAGEQEAVNVTLRNAGTVPLDQVRFQATASAGLSLDLHAGGETIPVDETTAFPLAPGENRPVTLTVEAAPDATGEHTLELQAAGVMP